MQLHLGGHLNFYMPDKQSWLRVPLEEETSLRDILQHLRLPEAEVALVVCNGEQVDLGTAVIKDKDRVDLYPPIGGGLGS